MSEYYAIKDTTLTALGDAVRSKVIGVETPEEVYTYTFTNTTNNTFNLKPSFKTVKYKYLIGGAINNDMMGSNISVYKESYSLGEKLLDKSIINSQMPYEIITDCDDLFISVYIGYSSIQYDCNITIIGVDENGNEYKYTPLEMAEIINGLEIPNVEPVVLTGSCSYACGGLIAGQYLNNFGDTVSTKDISAADNMFYKNSIIEYIPFDINISSSCDSIRTIFYNCIKLKEVPAIIGPAKPIPTGQYNGVFNTGGVFNACKNLREIPEDYFWKMVPNKEYWDKANELHLSVERNNLFFDCYSLRELPDLSMFSGGKHTATYYAFYYGLANQCYALNRIINLPIFGAYTSNGFGVCVNSCGRLADFIFQINEDGTPIVAPWKNQTIDLSSLVGYTNLSLNILNYNSGITADKQVTDDATYQALKNDPDWFTLDANYSRYNHNSAVNTINSLPDCSASGGTNTIKFNGASGALTDGGAINTLTEEEIAVATAKGWTVSLV